MKKKLLTFIMALVLAVPVVGSIGEKDVEAADVTDQAKRVLWSVENPGSTIPEYSDELINLLFKESLEWENYLPAGEAETIGPNSVLRIDWAKTTVSKDDIVAVTTYYREIEKIDGKYHIGYSGDGILSGADHPKYWGGDTNYQPSVAMNSNDFTWDGQDWSWAWEDAYKLGDWVKSGSFPGMSCSGEYAKMDEYIKDRYDEYGDCDIVLVIEVRYWDENHVQQANCTAIPFEKSSGKYVAEFKEPAESGEIEEVDLSNQESQTISNEDFNKLIKDNKEKDIVIKNKDGLTFTFPKGSLSAVEGKTEYDFGTTFVNEFSSGTLPSFVTASNFVKTISFGYSGKLPGKATIKIPLGAEYAGKTLYYSYVKESGLTEVQEVTADAEGNIEVTQDHCSDYVVTTENPDTQAVKSPATGDASFTGVLFMILLLSLVGAGIAMRVRANANNKQQFM